MKYRPKIDYSFSPRNLALLVSIAILYFIAGKLGLRVEFVHPYVTPIWIPAGIALASMVLFGYRVWPAIFVGALLDHLTAKGWDPNTLAIPISCVLEGFIGAYLVNKFARGAKAFDTAKGVFLFVFFACICAPIMNPAVGLTVNHFSANPNNLPYSPFRFLTWWFANVIGTLLVAPFLILLFRDSHHRMDWREFSELIVLLSGLIFVCLLVFGPLSLTLNQDGLVRIWVCIPFLIWASFRFCPLEATGTTVILFGSAVWGTLHGTSVFVARNLTIQLVALDSFIGVIGTMTLVVAAMVMERRRIEGELLGTQALLRDVLSRKDQELVETVHALDLEIARHAETKKVLHQSREQVRFVAKNANLD